MKAQNKADRRLFWCSLGVSLFLLITALGLAAVDYQGRRLSFGDEALPLRLVDKSGGKTELEVELFGLEDHVDVTKLHKFWDFLCDFGCIPHK